MSDNDFSVSAYQPAQSRKTEAQGETGNATNQQLLNNLLLDTIQQWHSGKLTAQPTKPFNLPSQTTSHFGESPAPTSARTADQNSAAEAQDVLIGGRNDQVYRTTTAKTEKLEQALDTAQKTLAELTEKHTNDGRGLDVFRAQHGMGHYNNPSEYDPGTDSTKIANKTTERQMQAAYTRDATTIKNLEEKIDKINKQLTQFQQIGFNALSSNIASEQQRMEKSLAENIPVLTPRTQSTDGRAHYQKT